MLQSLPFFSSQASPKMSARLCSSRTACCCFTGSVEATVAVVAESEVRTSLGVMGACFCREQAGMRRRRRRATQARVVFMVGTFASQTPWSISSPGREIGPERNSKKRSHGESEPNGEVRKVNNTEDTESAEGHRVEICFPHLLTIPLLSLCGPPCSLCPLCFLHTAADSGLLLRSPAPRFPKSLGKGPKGRGSAPT